MNNNNFKSYYIGDAIYYSEINDEIIPNTIENMIIHVTKLDNIISYYLAGRLDVPNKKIDKSYSSDIINTTNCNNNNSCIFESSEDFVKITEEWVFDDNFTYIDSYTTIQYYNSNTKPQHVSVKYILFKNCN